MKRAGQLPGDSPPTESLRRQVREIYARAAAVAATVAPDRRSIGCTPHSGLGCGSPTAFASLSDGESVLDLGCGAGFDCLAAAVDVGRTGRVVGIDMTLEMVRLARRHAHDAGVATAHFLQAQIEHLPFPDASFDVVISNCVINLCADKAQALAEACRVLKPNGRLAVADIVAVAPLPAAVREDLALHAGCIAGATPLAALDRMLREAGFASADIAIGEHSGSLIGTWAPGLGLERLVAAANITARKEANARPPTIAARPRCSRQHNQTPG